MITNNPLEDALNKLDLQGTLLLLNLLSQKALFMQQEELKKKPKGILKVTEVPKLII